MHILSAPLPVINDGFYMDWSRGGVGYKMGGGGGHVKFYPYEKGGGGKTSFSYAEGGSQSFGVVLT